MRKLYCFATVALLASVPAAPVALFAVAMYLVRKNWLQASRVNHDGTKSL